MAGGPMNQTTRRRLLAMVGAFIFGVNRPAARAMLHTCSRKTARNDPSGLHCSAIICWKSGRRGERLALFDDVCGEDFEIHLAWLPTSMRSIRWYLEGIPRL